MARTYDRKQRKWVDDPNEEPRQTDARLGDAKDAGSLGYTNISRGMDGKIDSAKDATGQVVQFINGQAPERVQLSQQSQGFSSPIAPLSAAQLAARRAPASPDGRLPVQPVSTAPVALAGTPAGRADALRQAATFPRSPISPNTDPLRPFVGTGPQILGQRAQAAATQASLRSTPPPPVYGKVQQAPAFSDPLRPASEVSRVTDADGIFTAHTTGGGTVTGAGPMSQGFANDAGIFVNGKPVTHDGRGNLVADIPRPSLDAAAQKDIVSQYPEVANAGSWANTKFTAGLKLGVNTPAAAQDVLAGLTVKPFDLAKSVPSLNGTFGANTSPIAPHVRPGVPAPRGTGEPVNTFPPGYAAGQSARTGLAQGASAAAGAFDSAASKVGGTLSTAENAARGFIGASPAIASGAPVKAVDDYMANKSNRFWWSTAGIHAVEWQHGRRVRPKCSGGQGEDKASCLAHCAGPTGDSRRHERRHDAKDSRPPGHRRQRLRRATVDLGDHRSIGTAQPNCTAEPRGTQASTSSRGGVMQ